MPPMFSYTLLAPNVARLGLRILSSPHQSFPAICPRSLRKVNIVVERQPFNWDVFRIDNETRTIAFNNLVDLSISGAIQVPSIDNTASKNNLDLVFPKLERLYLSGCNLNKNDAQAIVGHRLKQLHYDGSIIVASELCKQPLRNLDKLVLVWERNYYPEEAANFVTLANKIFNKTDGIEHVHCKIHSVQYTDIINGVNWPYLTHLSLGFTMPFKVLFELLPKVPNLVYLDVFINTFNDDELTHATELLTNIKEHYPEPSSSKITTLLIYVQHNDLYEESCCQKPFYEAVQNLRWYWPHLKNIDIQN